MKNDYIQPFLDWCKKHAPQILAGIGVTGAVATTILAVKATREADKAVQDNMVLDEIERAKLTWKYYIPTAVSLAATSAAIISSAALSTKREAALSLMLSSAQRINENFVKNTEVFRRENKEFVDKKIEENRKQVESALQTNPYFAIDLTFRGVPIPCTYAQLEEAIKTVNYVAVKDQEDVPLSLLYEQLNWPYVKGSEYIMIASPNRLFDPIIGATNMDSGDAALTFEYAFWASGNL